MSAPPENESSIVPLEIEHGGVSPEAVPASDSPSTINDESIAKEIESLQGWHRVLIRIYLPLVITILIMSCFWADIYGKKQDYANPNGSWEACFVNADYTYLPLDNVATRIETQITAQRTTLATCVAGYAPGPTIGTGGGPGNVCARAPPSGGPALCYQQLGLNCLAPLAAAPISIPLTNQVLPTGHFLEGFSHLGIQACIFATLAHAVLFRALKSPVWVKSSLMIISWFLFAIFTYYRISPILPAPNNINSSFISYLVYLSSYGKFHSYNGGENHCLYALGVAWFYNVLVLFLALTVFGAIVIGSYAAVIQDRYPSKVDFRLFKATEAPAFFAGLAILSYIVFVAGRITSMGTMLDAINNYDVLLSDPATTTLWYPRTYYPFIVPTIDITTIAAVLCVMATLRGYTTQDLWDYRVAVFCAVIYGFSIFPLLAGSYEFYRSNDFDEKGECKNFFLGTNTAQFGYPSHDQAEVYCQTFRLSLIAMTVMAFAILGVAGTAGYALYVNWSVDPQNEATHRSPQDAKPATTPAKTVA